MASLHTLVTRFIMLAAVALFGVTNGQTGGFSSSCFAETHAFVNPYLGMYCLNRYVADYGYNWTCGNYLPTCGGCKTLRQKQDIKLSCNCFDNQGRRPGSSVDLNGFIFNQDGTLGCYSNLGNKTLVGPKPTPS